MKYGHFDDQKKEYVIHTPFTPYPWINYLGNSDYYALFSNTGGGYSFFKDARLRRITRYRYNNVPVDGEGRYFFIQDQGVVFNIGGRPAKTGLDAYRCRHGMGYSIIESQKNDLHVKQTSFVPLGQPCEVHRIELMNDSNAAKDIDIFSYLEWNLWDAYDDMTNFQRNYNIGEVEVEGSVIYHKTEYKERRNHYAFYSVNHPLAGYDTDRETFVGLYNDLSCPDALIKGSHCFASCGIDVA
jgi:cellobiose phosphorylase